jgi:hypothetical protein
MNAFLTEIWRELPLTYSMPRGHLARASVSEFLVVLHFLNIDVLLGKCLTQYIFGELNNNAIFFDYETSKS